MEERNIELRTFEDLECWQACRELRQFVANEVASHLPEDEEFKLEEQLVRAARATTASVAEGYGHFYFLDKAKFCCQARGSCWAVLDQLITAADEGIIPQDTFSRGKALVEKAVVSLNGYIHYLKNAAQTPKPYFHKKYYPPNPNQQ